MVPHHYTLTLLLLNLHYLYLAPFLVSCSGFMVIFIGDVDIKPLLPLAHEKLKSMPKMNALSHYSMFPTLLKISALPLPLSPPPFLSSTMIEPM
eukprot:15342344-Ditylum_brightwellii.AAC.1